MKVKVEYIASGLIDYAESYMLPAMDGITMWVGAAALEYARTQSKKIADLIKEYEILKTLEIINAEGYIDIDSLIEVCQTTAKRHGKLDLELPMFGKFSLVESDFPIIGDCIKKSAGK